jgi:hypothetical protein
MENEQFLTPKTLKVAELRKHLSVLRLPTQGLKKDLTERLEEALQDDANLKSLSKQLYNGLPLTTPGREKPVFDRSAEDEGEESQNGTAYRPSNANSNPQLE